MKALSLVLAIAIPASIGIAQTTSPAGLDSALERAATFEYGESRDSLYAVRDFIRASSGDAVLLRQIESKLAALLDSNATVASKEFACRQLALIGTESSVPSLARMLARAETLNMALYALARIPDRSAGEAILRTLETASGKTKVAVINAIGARRDPSALRALRPLLSAADPSVATAAMGALAEIGGDEALAALAGALRKTAGALHLRASEAYLRCAASAGVPLALKAYKEVLAAA